MCGFLEVFQKNKPVDRSRFESALAEMRHRGPDDSGASYSSLVCGGGEVHVAAGHQRLAILDLDPRSAQPFQSGGRTLLFNGEIYNYQSLRKELEGVAEFHTSGDTEVLCRMLECKGEQALDEMNGMWAFAFLDREKRTVTACRDRYGKKPLFYYMDDEVLVFSSTVKSMYAYLGRSPRIRYEAMEAFLEYGVMYPGGGRETHLHQVRQVLPGQLAEFDLDKWEVSREHCYDGFMTGQDEECDIRQLPDLLRDAVKLRLVSDRPVGLMLSGGIDSTLILSVLYSLGLHETVRCYIGETGKSDDAKYARECAAQLGVDAKVVDLDYGDEAFNIFLKMCGHHEKAFPFSGNAMAMAEMYHRISEDGVPVVIDGTGGDEVFGGYWDRGFQPALKQAVLEGEYGWIREMRDSEPALRGKISEILKSCVWRNRLWTFDWKQMKRRLKPHYRVLGLGRSGIASPDPLRFPSSDYIADALKDISPGGRLGEWIWHNDRNAMMCGVENRSPMLDHRLRKFIRTGYKQKMQAGWNKHELRKVFSEFVELPSQWRRQKQGFRWDRKSFVAQNRDAVLELIGESKCLAAHYDTGAYVERAAKDGKIISKVLTSRLLCIAGLEEAMGLRAG